jgi:2'-5' RNA ligase
MREISSSFDEAWSRFRASEGIVLQQETLEWEWTRGRTDFVAFLIAISDERVREQMGAEVDFIAGISGVDLYPERYWHITVKQVGFLTESAARDDEVSTGDVETLSEAARSVLEASAPVEGEIGPLSAFPEVVFLEVHDGGLVQGMNRALMNVGAMPRYPVDGLSFLPHVSVARFSSDEGLGELKRRLAEERGSASGIKFRAEEVLLVQAHLAAEAPEFEVLATYRLGG